jgi:hypothetical protein
MSIAELSIIATVGVLLVIVLIYFLYRRRLSQPLPDQTQEGVVIAGSKSTASKPATSQSSVDENKEWNRMGISSRVIRNIERKMGTKILPDRLDHVTQTINQQLDQMGLQIRLTHSQALDTLMSQDHLSRIGKTVSTVDTALWLWLDRKIRKESKKNNEMEVIRDDEEISPEYMKKRFEALVAEIKKRQQEKANEEDFFADHQPVVRTKGAPVATSSVMDLIRQEAEFHIRKKLELGVKDPIPVDQKSLLVSQMKVAREQCREKGYIIPKEAEQL